MIKRTVRAAAILFTLLLLLVILNAKFFFTERHNLFLFTYGLTVTSVIFFTFLLTHTRYRDPSEEIRRRGVSKKLPKPFISCICAVYNEEKLITRCVDSLLSSTYPHKEILIVNDASTDGTRAVLDCYKDDPRVIVLHLKKNVGKKKAIAEALLHARGEIYVFTDSDSVIAPDAIERIVEIFAFDKQVGAVSGHGRALNSGENLLTRIQDSWYETQFSIEKAFESSYHSVTCVSGPLAVFRKAAIYNYIPAWVNDSFLGKEFRFATDRQLTGYVLGSRYIGKKLKEKYADSPFMQTIYPDISWKVLYCKSARVWTNVPNTYRKLVRQHVRWKKSFIRNIFFTGTFYWRKPLVPALKFYLGMLFTIVGPLIALRHFVYLPLTGNVFSGVYYAGGIIFIGSLYAIAFKLEHPDSHIWIYRPFMSVISTLLLSWLIFYSALTIKNPIWHRS